MLRGSPLLEAFFCSGSGSLARASPPRSYAVFSLGAFVMSVAPVAYQVIIEPGIGQFREFESPRVHTRINSWGLFLVHKLACGKRESVS